MHELQQATSQDEYLQHLKEYVICGWPESTDQIPKDMRTYWIFQDDMAIIDGVILKGKVYSNTRSITETWHCNSSISIMWDL